MKKKQRVVWIVSSIVALLLVGLGYIGLYGLPMKNGLEEKVSVSIENDPVIGSSGAPITIVEFADYKCIWCKKWNEEVYPLLKEDYIDTGKVKFVFKNRAFLGEDSTTAAIAGEAIFKQGNDLFWEYNHQMFKHQGDEETVWATEEFILDLVGKEVQGVDTELLAKDMADETFSEEVKQDRTDADNANIQGTPSILIDGQFIRNPFDYEFFKKALDEKLAEKESK